LLAPHHAQLIFNAILLLLKHLNILTPIHQAPLLLDDLLIQPLNSFLALFDFCIYSIFDSFLLKTLEFIILYYILPLALF
jgi:hypothetical protein